MRYRAIQHERWETLKALRSALLKLIEGKREEGLIKHSLEARVLLYIDPKSKPYPIIKQAMSEAQELGQDMVQFFKEFLIVSQVEYAPDENNLQSTEFEGLFARIEKAKGVKCPRCWQWEESEHEHGLCERCQGLVKQR